MKKIVPFTKEIPFDTNIAEINSISLERELNEKKEGLVSGKFIISGDYKMTDTSVSLDTFDYELPFNINIDKKYNIDNAEIDINDFYYEVLSVNIELAIDNIEEEEFMEPETIREAEEVSETCEEETSQESDRKVENIKSLFDGLDENENYVVYKIHIVTENDTIESIANDYAVSREEISAYNDLSEIKIGDKIIIPANEN